MPLDPGQAIAHIVLEHLALTLQAAVLAALVQVADHIPGQVQVLRERRPMPSILCNRRPDMALNQL